MTRKLYVNYIDAETTDLELREVFEQVGSVLSARIAIHPITGRQRNYGFVEMETLELALLAAERLNNHVLHDHKLHVTVVLPREERKVPPRADLTRIELKKPGRPIASPRSR